MIIFTRLSYVSWFADITKTLDSTVLAVIYYYNRKDGADYDTAVYI